MMEAWVDDLSCILTDTPFEVFCVVSTRTDVLETPGLIMKGVEDDASFIEVVVAERC